MRFPHAARIVLATAACAALAGCVSQSNTQTHAVTDNGTPASAHRRSEVHTSLAGEYFSRGNFNVALAETKLAIKDDPAYVSAYNMQGLIYMELREDVAAREAFDRALSLDPNNAEVLNNFGWFLCTRNDTTRAMGMLQRAASDPLYPTPEKAYLSTGLCLRRMHQDKEAEQYLRRAVSVRPDMVGALYNLAAITAERKDFKEAQTYLTRYMHLVNNPPIEGLVLGVTIARGLGDSGTEQSYLQQLRRRYPDAPQTRELAQKH